MSSRIGAISASSAVSKVGSVSEPFLESCRSNGAWPNPLGPDGNGTFDLVITWWTGPPAAKKTSALQSRSLLAIEGQSEIMYELRSFEKFGLLDHVRDVIFLVDAEVVEKYGAPRFFNYSSNGIRVVTDQDLGVDNRNCSYHYSKAKSPWGCGKWSKLLAMHTIPGLSDYFLYVPDDILMLRRYDPASFYDSLLRKPIVYSYGTWVAGWCDDGEPVGTTHGPVLMNTCAMRAVAEKYRSVGFHNGTMRGRRRIDALCLYSNAVKREWIYRPWSETSSGFFQECHTNGGCHISQLQKDTVFANVQGPGISDEYWVSRQEHADMLSFFHGNFPTPSRFELGYGSASLIQTTRATQMPILLRSGVSWLNTVLMVVACWLVFCSRGKLSSAGFLGLQTSLQVGVFTAYVGLACTHTFLQRRAGRSGYSVISATILIYALKAGVASVMFCCRGLGGPGSTGSLLRAGHPRCGWLPAWALLLAPAGLLAIYDVLIFVALANVDPVTYTVFRSARIFLVVLVWQPVMKRQLSSNQLFAFCLFFAASCAKGLDQIGSFGIRSAGMGMLIVAGQICISVVANVASEWCLKELEVHTDLLNACQYFQGLCVLLGVLCLTSRPSAIASELLAPAAWRELSHDPWMILSITTMVAFGIVTAYLLKELSNILKELSTAIVIAAIAVVEWFVLRSSSCTRLGVQAVVLAAMAIVVYSIDPVAGRPAVAGAPEGVEADVPACKSTRDSESS